MKDNIVQKDCFVKVCAKCGKTKDVRQFYRCGSRSRHSACMDCVKLKLSHEYKLGKLKLQEEMNMITINMDEYRLTYFRISDGKRFLVRRVTNNEYVLYDPEENNKTSVSYYFLKKRFVPCSDNFSRVKESVQLRVC